MVILVVAGVGSACGAVVPAFFSGMPLRPELRFLIAAAVVGPLVAVWTMAFFVLLAWQLFDNVGSRHVDLANHRSALLMIGIVAAILSASAIALGAMDDGPSLTQVVSAAGGGVTFAVLTAAFFYASFPSDREYSLLGFFGLGGRKQAAIDLEPGVPWYELPDDATMGSQPYDATMALRVMATLIEDDAQATTTEIYDLQYCKQAMTLYMMFANGAFVQMRAECESEEVLDLLRGMAKNIGAFEPCPAEETIPKSWELYREGYEAYHSSWRKPVDGFCVFINPEPNPSAFANINETPTTDHDDSGAQIA